MAEVIREGVAVELVSRVQLRAVFSGLAVAAGVFALCMGLSWAIGLSTFQPTAAHARGLALGSIIWGAIALWISIFLGAFVAAQVGRSTDTRSGIYHGLVVWGASAALLGFSIVVMFSRVADSVIRMSEAVGAAPGAPALGTMANAAGLTTWFYWAGIAGGLLTSILGGSLGARGEAKAPERVERKTVVPTVQHPAY